jgi:phosphopantetheine adenylyltransferase
MPEIEALVISRETVSGAAAINQYRSTLKPKTLKTLKTLDPKIL